MTLLVALLLVAQGGGGGVEPLRKSDLVRLLSGSALTQDEIAQLVRRNCLTFEPTERDRRDFRSLGAGPVMLAAVDECARRRARPPLRTRPPAPTASEPAARPPTPSAPPPPPAAASADRSGFAEGRGQSGAAGSRLPRTIVFEVRDSAGAPLAGQTVVFTGINVRVSPASVVTDGGGRARSGVTLGERVGSATVIAAVGQVEKQVAFNVSAGPTAELALACAAGEGGSLAGRLAIAPDTAVALRVTARDAYGNPTPLAGLRAAVADARILRVVHAGSSDGTGSVTLKPDQAGTTSVAVIANGLRQYLTVIVLPRGARDPVGCP